ncbi:acyltransferase family protein [Microcoleus vaginatus]|uniref:acyltransferase family protein n=1 Tax=Microcoleus vaginatus TaxID=119532 RepID=UPI0016892365|nr:acyltransferase [Microcoleus sp. FACHB-84]MBD2010382.1 acyltransferase [Microcoleus sp. FACHB-45]
MAPSKFYIPSLDGMRTIAFLMVFLSHAGATHIVPGGFGVTVFFFLSGYLITTLLRREYEKNQVINFKHFYLRRIVRIWPGFYLVLFLGTILTLIGVLAGEIQLPAFLSQVLHYYNYYEAFVTNSGIAPGTGVYWSLAVEEHFYCLFPFLYISLLKMRVSPQRQMLIIWGICLAILIWRCVLVFGMGANESRIYHLSDTRIDSILFGCALAVNGNPVLDTPYGSDRLWKYFVLPGGITILLLSFICRSPEFETTLRYTIQGIALHGLFIAAIRFPDWGVFQILNWNWMRFIGLLSYSLYLVHDTVIHAVYLYLPQISVVLRGAISMLICFILAYAIYRYIELPCGKLRKHLSSSSS